MLTPRQLIIRYITPQIWRLAPARKVAALQEFSMIERDSGCQLLICQKLVQDPHLKSYLFQHVLEEFYHSEIFLDLARSFSTDHFYEVVTETKHLLNEDVDKKILRDFFAYIHIGERTVNRDFLIYGRASEDPKVRSVFFRAGSDEGHHEVSTEGILLEFCSNNRWQFILSVCKARVKRLWNSYVSAMNQIGKFPLFIILSILYFVSGPIVSNSLRRRLALGADDQLRIFREQIRDFEVVSR